MQVMSGKTYEGPDGSEWNMTVLIIDNNEVVCLPNRPGGLDEAQVAIKWQSAPPNSIPVIERVPLRQFSDWAKRCISE